MYTLFPPLAIWKQKFDFKVLDCFISFVSVLEKKKKNRSNKTLIDHDTAPSSSWNTFLLFQRFKLKKKKMSPGLNHLSCLKTITGGFI